MYHPDQHVQDHVDDYLHDLLTPKDAAAVEQHCANCPSCKTALEDARRRLTAIQSVPASEASEGLIQASLQTINDFTVRRRRLRRLFFWGVPLAAAASVAVLVSFAVYYRSLKPSPFDLRVLGQSQLLPGSTGAMRIRLLYAPTGAALTGVPVDLELRDMVSGQTQQLASFTTNAQGTGEPRFTVPDWKDGSFELRIVARTEGREEVLSQWVQLKRSWKLMLSSDKPVYQPGQTIHVRALALLRPDSKPVADHDVTLTVSDPKGNVIFKKQAKTSKYGITATDCPLASEIIEGTYAINCQVGDTASKLTVDVKKYVLPKFKIDVQLEQPFYQPGQEVRGTVSTGYFFGKPVADGQVEVVVRTFDAGPAEIQRLKSRLNAKGKMAFQFPLPPALVGRPQDGGDARVHLDVAVTDPAGQKQSRTVSRLVTTQPLRIEVIPEAGAPVPDVPNTIYVYVSTADGRPAKARLNITGLNRELTTNELGVASFEITPSANDLLLNIQARDDQGRNSTRQVRLPYGQIYQDYLIRTDRAVYDAGQTLHLTALGAGQEPIFVDFIKDGQTILTETINLTNGRGDYRHDLAPELAGTVQLCAYRFGPDGLPVRKLRVVYVRPPRQLKIETTLDKPEYRPGGRARLQMKLTNLNGEPAPGAISLAAVDEAVFSVLDQAPGMERTFFALEQELLQPVYTIYPWTPDLETRTPPAQRIQFEQALFSRTAQTLTANASVQTRNPGGRRGERFRQMGDERQTPATSPAPATSPHTLEVASAPLNLQQVERTRARGLERVMIASVTLAILLALVGYIAMWVFIRPIWVVFLLHGVGMVMVCCMGIMTLGENASGTFSFVAQKIAGAAKAEAKDASAPDGDAATTPRLRSDFPETLLWRPEVITDDHGQYTLDVDLADSITTWRLTASAVTADGRLGATQSAIRVFQPFFVDLNLPVALTRGDEVSVPVVLYNYLKEPQTVELTLEDGPWFERLDDSVKQIELAANDVRSTSFRLRVNKVGNHHFQVTARGSGVADAVKRSIEVVPDGRRVETAFNGTLQQPASITLTVPEQAIEGSPRAILKLYPSSFSQLVEGLDAIFRMPSGCFEQTSSTTYPNVLALDYLRRANKQDFPIEAKARTYIHLGYQRLLSFEVSGGGFDWYGRPPANARLTAYGLMEFQDMARVHDVDPKLIQRTRQWLLSQRTPVGSWSTNRDRQVFLDWETYGLTAYIAWAVFSGQNLTNEAFSTLECLLSYKPEHIRDAYVLALTCNALLAIEPSGQSARPYLDKLESMKRTSADGKLTYWLLGEVDGNNWLPNPGIGRTAFFGAGRSGNIETTALAVLAMLASGHSPATTRAALAWLVEQKDPSGTWYSTQATVLALKALIAATKPAEEGQRERRIELAWDDGTKREIAIPVDQADVMRQINLSEQLKPGARRLTLSETSGATTNYQLAFRYHVPGDRPAQDEPLTIQLTYDRTDLTVGDTMTAEARVTNRLPQAAPMVMLDLPIPAGFTLVADDLAAAERDNTIARFQVTPRSAIVYLRALEPDRPLKLQYRLRAMMPVKLTVAAARVYEYYDTDKQGRSATASVRVAPRQ